MPLSSLELEEIWAISQVPSHRPACKLGLPAGLCLASPGEQAAIDLAASAAWDYATGSFAAKADNQSQSLIEALARAASLPII